MRKCGPLLPSEGPDERPFWTTLTTHSPGLDDDPAPQTVAVEDAAELLVSVPSGGLPTGRLLARQEVADALQELGLEFAVSAEPASPVRPPLHFDGRRTSGLHQELVQTVCYFYSILCSMVTSVGLVKRRLRYPGDHKPSSAIVNPLSVKEGSFVKEQHALSDELRGS
uniref:Uncharacterized protein n=1 Tax=Steinernema glaseri TaxID=37863 RepID=A0A1I7ZSY6_9BILA